MTSDFFVFWENRFQRVKVGWGGKMMYVFEGVYIDKHFVTDKNMHWCFVIWEVKVVYYMAEEPTWITIRRTNQKKKSHGNREPWSGLRTMNLFPKKNCFVRIRASLAVTVNRRELKKSGGFTVSVLGLRANGARKRPSPKTIFSGPRTPAHPAPTYTARRREFGSEPVLLRRENPSRRRCHREHTSTPASN
jgi:hypothetical protein